MNTTLLSMLMSVAAKVGAPIVRQLLERHVGGAAGDIGGVIVDAIAGKVGVPVNELPDQDATTIEKAVRDVETDAHELVAAWVEQQREANRLMLAEMEKSQSIWSWAWRPATMWLIAALWIWSIVLVPLVNAIASANIPLFLGELTFLTGIYLGLYMGGHTVKDVAAKWTARPLIGEPS